MHVIRDVQYGIANLHKTDEDVTVQARRAAVDGAPGSVWGIEVVIRDNLVLDSASNTDPIQHHPADRLLATPQTLPQFSRNQFAISLEKVLVLILLKLRRVGVCAAVAGICNLDILSCAGF